MGLRNCGHQRRIGKKPARLAKQQELLERIRHAVADVKDGVVIQDWKEETKENGDIVVTFHGYYGREDSMLSLVTERWFGITVTRGGALRVFHDSKDAEQKSLEETAKRFRRGSLRFW